MTKCRGRFVCERGRKPEKNGGIVHEDVEMNMIWRKTEYTEVNETETKREDGTAMDETERKRDGTERKRDGTERKREMDETETV